MGIDAIHVPAAILAARDEALLKPSREDIEQLKRKPVPSGKMEGEKLNG